MASFFARHCTFWWECKVEECIEWELRENLPSFISTLRQAVLVSKAGLQLADQYYSPLPTQYSALKVISIQRSNADHAILL